MPCDVGSGGVAPCIPNLSTALDAGEWSTSHPGHFIPEERTPGTNWISAGQDTMEKTEALTLPRIKP
jgi:hypothetical protein